MKSEIYQAYWDMDKCADDAIFYLTQAVDLIDEEKNPVRKETLRGMVNTLSGRRRSINGYLFREAAIDGGMSVEVDNG